MRPFPSTDLGRAVFASGLPVRKAKSLFTALAGARNTFDSTTAPLQLLWAVLQGVDNDLKINNWNMWKKLCNNYLTAEYRKLAGVILLLGGPSSTAVTVHTVCDMQQAHAATVSYIIYPN